MAKAQEYEFSLKCSGYEGPGAGETVVGRHKTIPLPDGSFVTIRFCQFRTDVGPGMCTYSDLARNPRVCRIPNVLSPESFTGEYDIIMANINSAEQPPTSTPEPTSAPTTPPSSRRKKQ